MKITKENVNVFNNDVLNNDGYQYTQNASYSSKVSNKRITDETFKIIKKLNPNEIIDIGCGDGAYTIELYNLVSNIKFSGFDPANVAIDLASKKEKNISFFVGNILDASSFPAKKYDLGIIRGVLHHLPVQIDAIKNSANLSDNIIIIEPNGNNPILKKIEKTSDYHIKHEEQSFSSDQLIEWCIQAGFKVSSINYIGFVPFFFPTFLSKVIYFFQPALELIYPLKKYFGAQIVLHISKDK